MITLNDNDVNINTRMHLYVIFMHPLPFMPVQGDMTLPTKKPNIAYHHGNLREALIDYGLEILQEYGPERMSLREVARRAGVSQAAPYRHFQDKEDLYFGIAERGFTLLKSMLLEMVAQFPDDPLMRIRACGRQYFVFARMYPEHFRCMFGDYWKFDPKTRPACAVALEALDIFVTQVKDCQTAGLFDNTSDAMSISMFLWSSVHGYASLYVRNGLFFIEDEAQKMGPIFEMVLERSLLGALKRN